MFESDDFDQVLSQFDFPEVPLKTDTKNATVDQTKLSSKENIVSQLDSLESSPFKHEECHQTVTYINRHEYNNVLQNSSKPQVKTSLNGNFLSPKHTKRKIIDSHFDHKSKRKFPGPAGLLSGSLEENKDETICHMELLSQDLEFSETSLRKDLFESSIWMRLVQDVKMWNLCNTDLIKNIKLQAQAGHLTRGKAQTVIAFVESVDRSVIDPLVILRDSSGHIKCTLHRDAWSAFSPYIVSEYSALVLLKPTVLTTGGAFKKHYLNITLSNIYAIYSSAVLKEDEIVPLEGYETVSQEEFTVIKKQDSPQDIGPFCTGGEDAQTNEDSNLLDDLDTIFSEDLF